MRVSVSPLLLLMVLTGCGSEPPSSRSQLAAPMVDMYKRGDGRGNDQLSKRPIGRMRIERIGAGIAVLRLFR